MVSECPGGVGSGSWPQCYGPASSLVLAANALTAVSERVGDLRRLRMLDLDHNRLHELPIGLGRLEGLSFLYLQDNRLTPLPDSLSPLERLRYLNISQNAFDIFPEVVTASRVS